MTLPLASVAEAVPNALASLPIDGVAGRAAWVVALLVAASALWWVARRRAQRFRAPHRRPTAEVPRLTGAEVRRELGTVGTFVQFSAATCATCPQVHRLLSDVAAAEPGVVHVELASEDHMELVRRLSVFRTPTVLLLDAAGAVHSRMSGPLTPSHARAALIRLTSAAPRSIDA